MDDRELQERVRELHGQGASTNHIARVLGVPRGQVAPLVRAIDREQRSGTSEPAVSGCWVSAGWSAGLTVDAGRGWPDRSRPGEASRSGLVAVLVARGPRRAGGDVSVGGYLVDTYCLGVKDALPPRRMSERRLPAFVRQYFGGYDAPPVVAPIELARHLVWGGVEYARGLGFEPHPDLRRAAGHLGPLTEPCAIGFGCDGRPTYVQGPFDDPVRVMRTLERTVGRDTYHFTVRGDTFEVA